MSEEDVEMFYQQAISFMGQGETKRAVEFFDKALAIDPMYSPAWNDKGIALMELKDYKGALECFDKVMNIDPVNSMPIYNMGYALLISEEYEKSVAAFDLFLDRYSGKDDFYKYALFLKAEGHYNLKQYDQARELLEKSLHRDKTFKEARELLIKVLNEENKS